MNSLSAHPAILGGQRITQGRLLWPTPAQATSTGGTVIAWTEVPSEAWTEPEGTRVHLTRLDASGARAIPDTVLSATGPADRMGVVAMAVTPDDTVTLLVVRSVQYLDKSSLASSRLFMVRVDPRGTVVLDRLLLGGCDVLGQSGCQVPTTTTLTNGGRLVWTGDRFLAYFSVNQAFGGIVHQADRLEYFSLDGQSLGVVWGFGCSHSLRQRLAWTGAPAPICLSEPGLFFNRKASAISLEPTVCYTELCSATSPFPGGLLALGGDLWHAYTSNVSQTATDVVLAKLSASGSVLARQWVTQTSGQGEDRPKLGAFEGGLVVGWRHIPSGTHFLQPYTLEGVPLRAPEAVPAELSPDDDFFSYPNGDLGWVWASASNELKVGRLARCQ